MLHILIFIVAVATNASADELELDYNLPVCGDILLARPRENLPPSDRPFVLADLNFAHARLRAELAARDHGVPIRPDFPEFPTIAGCDPEECARRDAKFDAELRAFRYQMDRMSRNDHEVVALREEVDRFDQLVRLIGTDQLDTSVEAFRLVGEAEIEPYLARLASGECLRTFEPVLRNFRPSATSAFFSMIEPFEIPVRRRWASFRQRTDRKCEILYPEPEGARLAERIGNSWSETAAPSKAFVSASLGDLGREFIAAFSKTASEKQRIEAFEHQMDFTSSCLKLFKRKTTNEDFYAYALRVSDFDLVIEFDWIPTWQENEDHRREPVLTVVTQVHATANRKPRRRRAVADEAVAESWAPASAALAR